MIFIAGQPLGLHASWPLFALEHHLLVWQAAEQCYPGRLFRNYALLGDDIVIADERVAHAYMNLLKEIDVRVSVGKSLTSNTGAAEFAKRKK